MMMMMMMVIIILITIVDESCNDVDDGNLAGEREARSQRISQRRAEQVSTLQELGKSSGDDGGPADDHHGDGGPGDDHYGDGGPGDDRHGEEGDHDSSHQRMEQC